MPSRTPEVNRRRFLRIAGATTAFTALSNSIQRAAALPANRRTGSIEDVEHIVVLMRENRSFDHCFGTLRGVRGFGDPRPLTWPNGGSAATVSVRPGARPRRRYKLGESGRWYDLTVTSEADPAFMRRFAGHVENGRPGVSDPAIATG